MLEIKGINIQEKSYGIWGTYTPSIRRVLKHNMISKSKHGMIPLKPNTISAFADLNLDYVGVS